MDRDFIWEADYGDREDVISATKYLLDKQGVRSLQCVSYFVNNNPYNLEFYILLSYNLPTEEEIAFMMQIFGNLGVKYRQDITMDALFREMANRRFDSTAFYDSDSVDFFESRFCFPERKVLEEKGYIMRPFSRSKEVFISHSSENKAQIKKLIPYLNGKSHSVWFDEYSLKIGDSLNDKIEKGIIEAEIVIFWITEEFLSSDWCIREMNISKENSCTVIYVVDKSVDSQRLPKEVRECRYLEVDKDDKEDCIIEKIVNAIDAIEQK